MRNPIYKSRPVAPNPARYGGQRYNDFIALSEAFSNCYRIATPEGCVQVNAGMGMEAPVIDANLSEYFAQPVHSLVLTQGHVDHVGGVQYFRDRNPGMRVIAGDKNAEHQAYDARLSAFRAKRSAFAFADKFAEIFAYYSERGLTDFPAQDVPTPDLLVSGRELFELGGIKFEVIAVAGAETNDSLILWLPQHKICFTGNLFGCPFGHFPNLVTIRGDRYRDPLLVAQAVDAVRALAPEVILYGHHGPVEGAALIREELGALHAAIHFVHDATVAGMNAGKTVYELMSSITLPAEFEVGQGYGKVSWGVRAIWEYYAGWFHHTSTTELYAVPRASVAADIVELAGAQALIERASAKLAEGDSVQALHLLDIVREAAQSTNGVHAKNVEQDRLQSEYRALAMKAHEALLADANNFWLGAWLKSQIKQLSKND
ncbi:MAG: MBL fold metallo-hydrolase [Gammaproteobacteria bacterium]|nr:MBL fold metallo-hydrolase [Gammaproteobacteria bacterium]NND38952.1 MBL fold metallo-hydrolase [Pseudomonadales bacterium]MBT8150652.1 MBL fold metallo-hydrolase [Gammaproteobacteria bacterium]NNL10686.1 MBL fold metallo-hydrolase [Pseudomonadales bacterium]NNM11955.1 MBL fold metallo-hydrolase [Pseudomonadales bacterium]